MRKINLLSWQIPFGKKLLFLCALIVLFGLASFTFSAYSKSEFQNTENQLIPDTLPENKQPTKTCCGRATQPDNVVETHTLLGTYYSLKDNQTSILMFNNKAPAPLVVNPIFFSLSGQRLDLPALIIPAVAYQEFNVSDLLAGHLPQFEEGNLQITHQGAKLQLGVQIKILKLEQGLIFDEQFVQSSRFVSSRLENVWWLPSSNSKTKFVLSNTTDTPLTATVIVDGTAPRQQQPATIELNPHQTRIVDILRDLVGQPQGGTIHKQGGISISHSGVPGAVLARMFVSKENTGFSSVVNFIDPEATAASKWHGSGYRIGRIDGEELTPILVARNIGNSPSIVSGRLSYTNAAGEVLFVNIPAVEIAAGEAKSIDVERAVRQSNVPENITQTGFEFSYSTPRGSVVMSALSVSRSRNLVFQVPLFDPNRMASSAGGYPWKADGDYTTMLYIKNETDTPKKYTARLMYEGGNYVIGEREIKGNQLVAIDFRFLRDEQTPDSSGNRIPLNIERGQIAWSVIGRENKTLSGRSEQSSVSRGISSSYDCRNCCPDSRFYDTVSPTFASAGVGEDIRYFIIGIIENCYGQQTPIEGGGSGWLSSNASVATIDGGGFAEGVSPGETTISTSWMNFQWFDVGISTCEMYENPGYGLSDLEVRPTADIEMIEAVGKGTNANVEITVRPVNNNAPIDLTLIRTTGTGEARFANDTTSMTITRDSTVVIKGVTESSVKDNIRLQARTRRGLVLDTENFSVARIKISRTIGTQQPTEITDLTTDTIVGERIKLNAEIVPSGVNLSNHLWTLPGSVMKEFKVTPNPTDPTQSSSQVVPVGNLNTTNVDYVWYDGGDNREITYKADAGNNQISAKTTFNVKRPEASVITISTNSSMTTIDTATGNLELHYGSTTPQTAGIRFSLSSITIPSPFAGDKQWVQTINRTIRFTDTNGQTFTVSNSGLDKCYPYDTINVNSTYDSPGILLSPLTYVNLRSQWTMWYMFKPSGSDSSWVPLRKVDWRWFAEAQLTNSVWNLLNYTNPNQPSQPTDVNATDFPIWSVVVPSAANPC